MSKVGKIIKIDNSNGKEKLSFIPYKQNFSFSIDAGNTLEFKTRNSIQSLYYEQSIPKGNVSVQDTFDPQPGGELTEFADGMTISGFDFGQDAVNGEESDAMHDFLNSLPTSGIQPNQDDEYELLPYTDDHAVLVAHNSFGAWVLIAYDPEHYDGQYVYWEGDPMSGGEIEVIHGWNNLTDGKCTFSGSLTIGEPNDITPPTWNGVLIGAVTSGGGVI